MSTIFLLDYEKNYLLKVTLSLIAAALWIPFQEIVYRPYVWFDHLVARVSFDTRAHRYKIVNKSESESLKGTILKQINTAKALTTQILTEKLKKNPSTLIENPINAEFVDEDLINWNFIDERANENLRLEIPVLTENEVESIFIEALEGDPTTKIMKVLVSLKADIRQLKSRIEEK